MGDRVYRKFNLRDEEKLILRPVALMSRRIDKRSLEWAKTILICLARASHYASHDAHIFGEGRKCHDDQSR